MKESDQNKTNLVDGWIVWNGGVSPVSPNTIVEVRYRNGESEGGLPARRFGWDHWGSDRGGWDIISYRIVDPS